MIIYYDPVYNIFHFSILGEVRLRRGASVINWNTMKRRNFFIVFVLESCKLVH